MEQRKNSLWKLASVSGPGKAVHTLQSTLIEASVHTSAVAPEDLAS
jgi:hypothetical protein